MACIKNQWCGFFLGASSFALGDSGNGVEVPNKALPKNHSDKRPAKKTACCAEP